MNKTTENGYFKIKTSDYGDRWIRFSMNCWLNLKKTSDKTMVQIGEALESGDTFDKVTSLSELIYAASMAYDQENGIDIDYNFHNAVNWLQEMDPEEVVKLYDALTWSNGANLKQKKGGEPGKQKQSQLDQ